MQWVFDLDDTLYAPAERIKNMVVPKIKELVLAATGIPEADYERERARLRHEVFLTNDTLLAFSLAYDLPYEEMVKLAYLNMPWDRLAVELRPGVKEIRNIPGEKTILTNAPRLYAEEVLSHFGLRDAFTDVLASAREVRIHKPDATAFDLVRAEGPVTIVDNRPENLKAPSERGWTTILFPDKEVGEIPPWVQRAIHSLAELK